MAIEIVEFSHEKWWIFPVRKMSTFTRPGNPLIIMHQQGFSHCPSQWVPMGPHGSPWVPMDRFQQCATARLKKPTCCATAPFQPKKFWVQSLISSPKKNQSCPVFPSFTFRYIKPSFLAKTILNAHISQGVFPHKSRNMGASCPRLSFVGDERGQVATDLFQLVGCRPELSSSEGTGFSWGTPI